MEPFIVQSFKFIKISDKMYICKYTCTCRYSVMDILLTYHFIFLFNLDNTFCVYVIFLKKNFWEEN